MRQTLQLDLHDSGGDKNGGLQLITDLIVGTLNDQTATSNHYQLFDNRRQFSADKNCAGGVEL